MARRPARARATSIAFMAAWTVLWTAGMVIVVWRLGASALAGEAAPALFMAVWLAAAAVGLVSAGRRLAKLLAGGDPVPRRATRRHAWDDGIPPAPPPE